MGAVKAKVQTSLGKFAKEERGDLTVAQLGAAVGVLVILGLIANILLGGVLGAWISQIWAKFSLWIANIAE